MGVRVGVDVFVAPGVGVRVGVLVGPGVGVLVAVGVGVRVGVFLSSINPPHFTPQLIAAPHCTPNWVHTRFSWGVGIKVMEIGDVRLSVDPMVVVLQSLIFVFCPNRMYWAVELTFT